MALVPMAALTACQEPNPEPVPPGCSASPTAGLESRTVDGRGYLLLVPPGLATTGVGAPLLLSLHGLNSSAAQMSGYTPWPALAPAKGFIVAYPDGLNNAWNSGQGSADVAFLRAVISQIESTYCTDRSRVHVTGHSLGAYMAQRMACDAPDVVASVAEYAGGPPTVLFGNTPCTPSRPISVALLHGEADRLVIPELGALAKDEWVARLACPSPPTTKLSPSPAGVWQVWNGCAGATSVSWRTYTGQGHLWPSSGAISTDIATIMWTFFEANFHPTR